MALGVDSGLTTGWSRGGGMFAHVASTMLFPDDRPEGIERDGGIPLKEAVVWPTPNLIPREKWYFTMAHGC